MYYRIYLFGIELKNSRYETTDLVEAAINVDLLRRLGRLQEVDNNGTKEYMATLTHRELPEYFLEQGNVERSLAEDWYNTLSADTVMIVVHRTTRDIYSKRRDRTVLQKYVQLNVSAR